jgi:hypothetical protein
MAALRLARPRGRNDMAALRFAMPAGPSVVLF